MVEPELYTVTMIERNSGFGGHSMFGRLRRALVCPPVPGFDGADPAKWHYTAPPDGARAAMEHAVLVSRLVEAQVEVIELPSPPRDACDALFTHDPSFVTDRGAIVLRMGKTLRRDESDTTEALYRTLGIPVLSRLDPPCTAEGGDLLWLDPTTLAVGIGRRTNAPGLAALRELLAPAGIDVQPVPLPEIGDAEACLHLGSVVSLVDRDLALVYPPLLPDALAEALDARGFTRVEVPDEEYPTLGTNVLALEPRSLLAVSGNPVTRGRLERAGCRVTGYPGREISVKAEGGPTCLTRPLLRDPVPLRDARPARRR